MIARALLCASTAVCVVAASPAGAADLNAAISFEIAPQPLDRALLAYSRQSGIQVLSSSQAVLNKQASGYRGVSKPERALTALLRGTDLTFTRSGVNTITIVPAATLQTVANVSVRQAEDVRASAASAPAAQSVGQLEEVVVTAQRRVENLQRAALSVDAISPAELQSVGTSATDLNRLVPSAQFQSNGGPYPSFYIRGVGNFNPNSYTDSTVGFNYDGVPITRAAATIGMFYDLERVEVLKGPQGTLYGRNNTGGAINVLPAHPRLGEYSGRLTVTAGNYDLIQGTGFVNVPMGDKAAWRASFNYIDRDGYYDNGLSDDVGRSFRLQLLIEPTDTLSVNLSADYHHQGGKGPGQTLLNTTSVVRYGAASYALSDGRPYGGDPWREYNTQCDGVYDRTAPFDADDYAFGVPPGTIGCFTDNDMDADFRGLSANINWTMPWATLTVLPSVRWVDSTSTNGGGLRVIQAEDSRTASLEARLASDSTKRFSWILGAFILDESLISDNDPYYIGSGNFHRPLALQDIDQQTKSQAAFATVRYSATDALRFSAGARYTHDERTFTGVSTILAGPVPIPLAVDADKTWDKVTYRLGAEYDLAPDSMLFATYETGYKSGGFFFASSINPLGQSFDPETVTAYTIGSRNMFFDRRLLLNVDVFRYEYRDQQVSQFAPDPVVPSGIFGTFNIGAVDYTGVEVEAQYYLTPTTLLRADVQYLNSEFKTNPIVPTPGTSGLTPAQAAARDAPFSPEWTATLGVQQTFELGTAGRLVANLNAQYRGDMLISTDFRPWNYVDAVTTGDVSLRYEPAEGDWSITGFVNNVTDEEVPTYSTGTGLINFPHSPPRGTYRAPRTYGVRVTAGF